MIITTPTLPVLSEEAIKTLIGITWFDIKEEDGAFVLETDSGGSPYTGERGTDDEIEGDRILNELQGEYNSDSFTCWVDHQEEWVVVTIEVKK